MAEQMKPDHASNQPVDFDELFLGSPGTNPAWPESQ